MKKLIILLIVLAMPALGIIACEGIEHREMAQEAMGRLCFNVIPETAEVYLDGRFAGLASELTDKDGCLGIERGRHMLEIRAEGFMPYEREIYVSRETHQINIKLAR